MSDGTTRRTAFGIIHQPTEPFLPGEWESAVQNPDREKLVAALDPSGIEGRHLGASHAGLVLHPRQAEAIADAILASDWLREHDRRVAAAERERCAREVEQFFPDPHAAGEECDAMRALAARIREGENE